MNGVLLIIILLLIYIIVFLLYGLDSQHELIKSYETQIYMQEVEIEILKESNKILRKIRPRKEKGKH